jgi:hypothetical protein
LEVAVEPANVKAILKNLNEIVLDLQAQIDESVALDAALIQTLNELLPGFETKFDEVYSVSKRVIGQRVRADLAAIEAELRKINP